MSVDPGKILGNNPAVYGSGMSASEPEPSELLRRLMDSRRPSQVLPFPRINDDGQPVCSYTMRILTQAELDEARANAERYTRGKLKETQKLTDEQVNAVRREAWSEIYEDAKCIELLYLACRQPDDVSRPLFVAPRQIRELLTHDEAAALFSAYEAAQYRFGPQWRTMSEAECDQLIGKLVEGASSYPLLHLGPGALAQLVVSLAFQNAALKTATGSSGSPSSNTATEPSSSQNSE